jgi:hypothetical protein
VKPLLIHSGSLKSILFSNWNVHLIVASQNNSKFMAKTDSILNYPVFADQLSTQEPSKTSREE